MRVKAILGLLTAIKNLNGLISISRQSYSALIVCPKCNFSGSNTSSIYWNILKVDFRFYIAITNQITLNVKAWAWTRYNKCIHRRLVCELLTFFAVWKNKEFLNNLKKINFWISNCLSYLIQNIRGMYRSGSEQWIKRVKWAIFG